MKEKIAKIISEKTKLKKEMIEGLIEIPPSAEMGDFAFPCFILAKEMKKAPQQIASELAKEIKIKGLEKIEAKGPYLNFFVDRKSFALELVEKIVKEKEKFGSSNEGKGKTIAIDLSSPNIAKPFGIGHLRSTIIGNSIGCTYKKLGYKIVRINYLGDWGTQFGKLAVGYTKFGDEKKLKENPTKHLLEIYVKANAEEYEQEARDWFKKMEDGDKKALALWKKFREMSLKDFDKIYKVLGVKFEVLSGESEYNKKMDATVEEMRKKGILEQSEGAEVVNLEKFNLGVCLIKKSDGATLYATRDVTAAIDRYKKYKFFKMIYEVGQEQKLHFEQVFKILELMGYNFAKSCVHVYHGLYLDEDGKKFATRKGKTVFMENILEETLELAKKAIEQKNPKIKNKEEVARRVAIAAIFYGDLKNNRTNDMVFDIDKFVEFEGNTGPYLLYSYVRANSILKKVKSKGKIKVGKLEEREIELVKKLGDFPTVVKDAAEKYNPALIAHYSYELAQIFNTFYHECPVLNSENEEFRLALVRAFAIVMKSSLTLLGIETIDEM